MPPPFFEMVGASDLVIHGTIDEVKKTTFVLKIKEVLVGDFPKDKIEIHKFIDWTCSSRWKPYKKGQEIIAFIQILPETHSDYKISKYALRSAGSEGEFPIVGSYVYYQGFSIPNVPQAQGELTWGHKFELDVMLSAIRNYKNIFNLKYDNNNWNEVLEIRIISDEKTINNYKETSILHKYLIETTLEQKSMIENKKR